MPPDVAARAVPRQSPLVDATLIRATVLFPVSGQSRISRRSIQATLADAFGVRATQSGLHLLASKGWSKIYAGASVLRTTSPNSAGVGIHIAPCAEVVALRGVRIRSVVPFDRFASGTRGRAYVMAAWIRAGAIAAAKAGVASLRNCDGGCDEGQSNRDRCFHDGILG